MWTTRSDPRHAATRAVRRAAPHPLGRGPARRQSRGFTLVSVVFILVALAALGVALAGISVRQQMGSAAALESARALQAARAGLEWAAFQVLRSPAPPAAAPACFATTSFTVPGLAAYTITVSCTRTPGAGTISDGATALAFYTLVANACNAPAVGACPTIGTPQPTYVERQLTWTVVR
jgi:MSHA biogenesis protein MshP